MCIQQRTYDSCIGGFQPNCDPPHGPVSSLPAAIIVPHPCFHPSLATRAPMTFLSFPFIRLAREMAEGDIAHSFSTFNTSYKDTGLFGVYLVCPDNKLDDALWHILDNLVRLCYNVTDAEVERAKTQLKAQMILQLDSFSSTCEDIGRQVLTYGRRMSTLETFARIDAITTADVKTTANKFINDEDHALAAVGPIFELPDYNFIRRRSYWHRY